MLANQRKGEDKQHQTPESVPTSGKRRREGKQSH